MFKNNNRNSCKFKSCSPFQFSYNLTEMKPVIGYYSCTHRSKPSKITSYFNVYTIYLQPTTPEKPVAGVKKEVNGRLRSI